MRVRTASGLDWGVLTFTYFFVGGLRDVGQGANLALVDAWTLSNCLNDALVCVSVFVLSLIHI